MKKTQKISELESWVEKTEDKIRNEKGNSADTTEIGKHHQGFYDPLYANKLESLEEMGTVLGT